jgi:hypothetical protein
VAIPSGDAVVSAAGEAAGGFAELLNGLATKAVAAVSGEDSGTQDGAADGAAPLAKDKTIKAHAGRQANAAKAATADGKDALAVAQAATAAASESGKILPVALPEAADADAGTVAEAATTETIATPLALGVLPALVAQTAAATPAPGAATASRRSVPGALPLTHKVNSPAAQTADKGKPEAQAGDSRPAAVAITVAAPALVAAPLTDEAAGTTPVVPARAKATRAADLARFETPLAQASAPQAAAASFAQADQTTPMAAAPAPTVSTPMPSPKDIDAALDHLVAAREALMPAEAALAIDHAEFGEVSIKFEQSADGRLSAELTAADPELKRAVTAAVATDRGPATSADGDNGRSAQLANHRGSAAGGDAAAGGRSQSGGHSGAERDLPQRRSPGRSPGGQTASDQRPGVFA